MDSAAMVSGSRTDSVRDRLAAAKPDTGRVVSPVTSGALAAGLLVLAAAQLPVSARLVASSAELGRVGSGAHHTLAHRSPSERPGVVAAWGLPLHLPLVHGASAGAGPTGTPLPTSPAVYPTYDPPHPTPRDDVYGSCHVSEERDREIDGVLDATRTTYYDQRSHRAIEINDTDADGTTDVITRWVYDEAGKLYLRTVDTDELGLLDRVERFLYDDQQRLIREESEVGGQLLYVWSYTYDDLLNSVTYTTALLPADAEPWAVRYQYDASRSRVVRYEFDDPMDGVFDETCTYTWSGGRLTRRDCGFGVGADLILDSFVVFSYDDGRLTRTESGKHGSPSGLAWEYKYDRAGRLVSAAQYQGVGSTSPDYEASYTYIDGSDRLAQILVTDRPLPPVLITMRTTCPGFRHLSSPTFGQPSAGNELGRPPIPTGAVHWRSDPVSIASEPGTWTPRP